MTKVNRTESKKSNVYKIEIKTGHRKGSELYVSSLIKVDRYIEEWAEENLPDVVYEIQMSRLKIVDDQMSYGTLVDHGYIILIDSDISFEIKIYRLHIL